MAKKTLNLTTDLYQYLLDKSLHEHEVLKALRRETEKLPEHEMQIAPDQGQFFTVLVKLMNASHIIDIGTFTGYSALVFALAIPENGHVITCDINSKCTEVAKQYWEKAGVLNKIELKLAPALDTLDQLLHSDRKNSFDIIFIDADKCNYDNYYEKSLQLLRKGGLVVADNVLWYGRVIDENDHEKTTKAIRNFNDKLAQDNRIDICMLPVADGVTLARKR